MRELAILLVPIAHWLPRNGVSYGALADQLEPGFLDAAHASLAQAGTNPKFSAQSALSGIYTSGESRVTVR